MFKTRMVCNEVSETRMGSLPSANIPAEGVPPSVSRVHTARLEIIGSVGSTGGVSIHVAGTQQQFKVGQVYDVTFGEAAL